MGFDIHKYDFSDSLASELGVKAAIIFQNIAFWVNFNRDSGTNYYDGKYWTFNSANNISKILPFISQSSFYSNINKLIDAGYIIRGNYNKAKYDRTSWYTLTDKGAALAYDYENQEN